MFENGFEYFVAEITDEDMEITEKWLIKVSIIEKEETSKDGEEYISRELVLELIRKFAPDETMILGFEVSKLPILYLPMKERLELEESKSPVRVLKFCIEKEFEATFKEG